MKALGSVFSPAKQSKKKKTALKVSNRYKSCLYKRTPVRTCARELGCVLCPQMSRALKQSQVAPHKQYRFNDIYFLFCVIVHHYIIYFVVQVIPVQKLGATAVDSYCNIRIHLFSEPSIIFYITRHRRLNLNIFASTLE